MSTVHEMFTQAELDEFVADLKEWPACARVYEDYELGTSPFLTFYFTYDPAKYLETSLTMVDIHEAFERLTGKLYKVATHPDSERPHPYGSKRLGDLREWARKKPLDKSFIFDFTDEKNHNSSPGTAGYFWRTRDWSIGDKNYSSIQLYYRWQWWLDNKAAWRRFVLETIERLKPEQVYSGFAMANPLAFGTRSEVTVWDRGLAPHFYGLDTDYPFSMRLEPQLPSGLRPPTWGFFLSDLWRSKLSLSREQVRAALADPRIRIDETACGQWIELGDKPDLYPVENGVPELPMRLNKLLKPIRHPKLGLLGFGEWDGDPNVRFNLKDTKRWLARFDEDGDWPSAEIRGSAGKSPVSSSPPRTLGGLPCPRTGWWHTPAQAGVRRYFKQGAVMPEIEGSAYGTTFWQWDVDQSNPTL